MSDVVPVMLSITPRLSVRIMRDQDAVPLDKLVIMPDRLELRRLSLHRNMILAADDIFEAGPAWVAEHYGSRRTLSLQLREFIDFCLDCGINDSDIRSHLMQLVFALDRPRWPECLATRSFERMTDDKDQAEASAMDWIYATRFQLRLAGKGAV